MIKITECNKKSNDISVRAGTAICLDSEIKKELVLLRGQNDK